MSDTIDTRNIKHLLFSPNQMDNNHVFKYDQHEEEEEEEETISLSDFPLNSDEHEDEDYNKEEHPIFPHLRSPPDQAEYVFEFSSNLISNNNNNNMHMSHAEDIIFCGKLIPFKDQNSPTQHPTPTLKNLANFHRRRSESLSELKSTCESNNIQIKMRNSRSLDYHKLNRTSSSCSDSPEFRRNKSSTKGSTIFDSNHAKVYINNLPKPKWYNLITLFGNIRFPPEMDLQDIKNRQVRRTESANYFFPSATAVNDKMRVNRKSSWGMLKVLSCRDDASVHVTTSLARTPRV